MAWFADLTPHSYTRNPEGINKDVVNIGWLDAPHEVPTGATVPDESISRLAALVVRPINKYRGSHICSLCPHWVGELKSLHEAAHGNGEIRIRHRGVTYVAPVLVLHYIIVHEYRPPDAFLVALREGDPIEEGTYV